jgi:hypothetical protein
MVIGYETSEQLDVEPAKYFVRVFGCGYAALGSIQAKGIESFIVGQRLKRG